MELTLAKMNESLMLLRNPEAQSHMKSKSIRIEMPKFDGENVQGWIYNSKKYLRYHNIPDEKG